MIINFLVDILLNINPKYFAVYINCLDELTIHIVFFKLITKEEKRKVIEPFYTLALSRYDDAKQKLNKYQTGLDKNSLTLLRFGVQLLRLYIEMFKEIMENDEEPSDMDVLLKTLLK